MDELDAILDTVESVEINNIVGEVLKGEFDVAQHIEDNFPFNKRVSLNEIVPEEYQQRLMAISDTVDKCYFMIGDITDELINSVNRQRSHELGKIITQTDIFLAVGYFCKRTGRSVRYYWVTASYFPLEVRQKYSEVPFNVYAMARWVDNPLDMIQMASVNPQWSAERVRTEYYKSIGKNPPVREKAEKTGSAIPGAEVDNESELGEVQGSANYSKTVLVSSLEHTIDGLRTLVDRIPLPINVRSRIGAVLLDIDDLILDIRREM